MDKLDFKKRKSKYAQRHDLIELRDQRALLSFRRMFKMSVMGMGGGGEGWLLIGGGPRMCNPKPFFIPFT